jgi:hypothetical protein
VPLVRLRDTGTAPFDVIFDMETNDPDDYLTLYALRHFTPLHAAACPLTSGCLARVTKLLGCG